MSLVTLLEIAVHKYARYIRRCKRLRIEPLNERAIDVVKKHVNRLRKLAMELNSILISINENTMHNMDQDSLTRLYLLTFFIYEVALSEEEEVLKMLLKIQNRLGVEIVSYKDIERVHMIKDLAGRINTSLQSLLK